MKRDLISSAFGAGFAILFCVGALNYEMLDKGIPGPGFVPLIVGLSLLGLCGCLAVQACKRGATAEPSAEQSPEERADLGRLGVVLSALALCLPAMEVLGPLIAMFLFLAILLRAIGSVSWKRTLLIATSGAVLCHVVFVTLLGIPLSKGFWIA